MNLTPRISVLRVSCIAALLAASRAGDLSAGDAGSTNGKFAMKTYTYKTVGDLKIQADVYRPDDTQPRPVLVWLHGGALMMGAKKWVQPDLMALCRSEGYCLVSANYRLAPQAKLPQIIEDLRDFVKWVNGKGPGLFHADASRVVVAGSSAGGYLTMMTGIIEPRPKGLVAYYGYGDVDGPWYTTPSGHYRKQPLVSKEDAYKGMTPEVVTEPVAGGLNRGRLYLYLRQNGLWTREVTGLDPATEKHKLTPYCPVRNITAKYPPIVMIHGTADTDVPCQESLDMAEQLKKNSVRHEMFVIPGAGHGLGGGNPGAPGVDKAMARAREFIRENLDAVAAAQATSRPAGQPPAKSAKVYSVWPFDAKEASRRQDETAKALGSRKAITLDMGNKVTMGLVLIPAGKFMMGSGQKELETVKRESGKAHVLGDQGQSDEDPQHEVTLGKPFYMGVYHVTRGQFAAFVADSGYQTDAERDGWSLAWDGSKWDKVAGACWRKPGFDQTDDHPAVCISHSDSVAFHGWLSKKTGRTVTLPTEAQWEYACRAGTATAYQWGDAPDGGKGWCNAADSSAGRTIGDRWLYFNWTDGHAFTSPVGRFRPNAFGLYDMHGNACQWCADWYDKGYYAKRAQDDPQGPANGAHRVLRGGGWFAPPLGCRSASRDRMMPDYRYSYFGFRVICTDVD